MWRLGFGIAVVVVAALGGGLLPACATRGGIVRPQPVQRWVDAEAPPAHADVASGGVPFRSLSDALRAPLPPDAPLIVNVRAGRYEGPFDVPPGVTLRGQGTVVLHAPPDAAEVVRLGEGASLENVQVQGAKVGVRVEAARARVRGVRMSGQRETGILVEEGGQGFEATDIGVEGTIAGASGVRITEGGSAELLRAVFRGELDAGLRLEPGARGRIVSGRSEGPTHGIRSNGAALEVEGFHADGGRAAGIALGGGRARLRGIQVTGHEYALLVGGGAEVQVEQLVSVRAERGGIGIAASSATLRDVLVLEAGAYGAVNAVGSHLELSRFLLSGARGYGLNLHGGTSEISHGAIRGIVDDGGGGGDGVHVRVGRARIAHVHLSDLGGVGVLAAQGATVEVRDLTVQRAAWAGLLAETLGRLEARSVIVERSLGVAVAIPGEADVQLDALVSSKNAQGTFWIECGEGAQLRLGRLHITGEKPPPQPSQPCIGRLGPP